MEPERGAACGVARTGGGVMTGAGAGDAETVGSGGVVSGALVSEAAGRTTGFCASTGPCAAGCAVEAVLLASGAGRLQPPSDCARTGAAASAGKSAVAASVAARNADMPLMTGR